ncbi:serine hydrolase domain-containing protein [Segetibacter koreensis]|uniref:serine hydrolase domain-containing protein n=1 Tax=Segetibacter koreensis TaxID=398037 RepID=UPI000373342D|nr:serine hydrolase [Segetibacter koreensis]
MRRIFLSALLLSTFFSVGVIAQTSNSLPHSTPEEEGVPAPAISTFLDSVNSSKHEFHSFMLMRHGKVIAEGWWNPYRKDLRHTLYSLSKSFTATAVGFARAEGKLSLTDKVVSFFPNEVPDTASANLKQLTVKDLLTMSVGQEPDPTGTVVEDTNWVKRFFTVFITYQPGSHFLYNSMATYMLSAIVSKVTGQKVIDYLQPRLFEPLRIAKPDWEESPQHANTGGWGLRLKTEDIAKFAQLFLQKGKWNGKQILPPGWAEEASTAHIIQHPEYSQAKRDSSDWEQGYCYQMWRCRNNAYRGDGAFGQYAIVMPEQDAVIAITSETADMQGELNLIWKILLPAMQKGKLAPNNGADAILKKQLAALALPVKKDVITPSLTKSKTFVMEPNARNIRTVTFNHRSKDYGLIIKLDSGTYPVHFAANSWQQGETGMKGPYLVGNAKNSLTGLPPFKVAAEYTWIDSNTLELVLRYIESPHTETMLCRFAGDDITVDIKRSFNTEAPDALVTLKGKAQ